MAAEALRKSLDAKGMLRRPQVEELVRLSRSSIYEAVRNQTFPAPYKIGARAVAWRQTDVEAWLDARPLAGAAV